MIYEPCKIADSNEKHFSFRPENNDLPKKGKIKLKPFITDYTRVNNYLSAKKEELEKYPLEKDKKGNEIQYNKTEHLYLYDNNNPYGVKTMANSEENNENKYLYLQPVMKFAPRTDFERIYDTINSYNYGSINKNLIQDQLKTLGFLTVQNYKNNDCSNEYSLIKEKFKVSSPTLSYLIKEKARLEKEVKTPETIDLLANINDIIKINKEIKHDQETPKISSLKNNNSKKVNITRRKIINNYLAKNILGEYQKKTHFKALLNCTLNLDKINNNKYKSLSENSRTYKRFNPNFYYRNENINDKIIKNKCFKPFHNKKQYPKEDLEYLKKLCSMTQNEYSKPRNQSNELIRMAMDDGEEELNNKYLKQHNTVMIKGKAYNKKDIPKISRVILKECNYIKKYFDNEKSGTGKTMITRGLSVEEFTKKFRLPK